MMSGLGNDIAETLRTGIKIDTNTQKLILSTSMNTDTAAKAR